MLILSHFVDVKLFYDTEKVEHFTYKSMRASSVSAQATLLLFATDCVVMEVLIQYTALILAVLL